MARRKQEIQQTKQIYGDYLQLTVSDLIEKGILVDKEKAVQINLSKLSKLLGKKVIQNNVQKDMARWEFKSHEKMSLIKTTNPELRDAYYEWIYAMYEKFSTISNELVLNVESDVNKWANGNLDKALWAVKQMTIYSYRELQFVVNKLDNRPSNKDNVTSTITTEEPIFVDRTRSW